MTSGSQNYDVREVSQENMSAFNDCVRLQMDCFGYDEIDVYSPKIIQQILGNPGGHLIMAFQGKEPVGFCIVGSHFGGRYHVFREGVHKDHRKQALGKRMRHLLIDIGKSQDHLQIDLTFSAQNLPAALLNIRSGAKTLFVANKYKGPDPRLTGLAMDRLVSIYHLDALRSPREVKVIDVEWILDDNGFHEVSNPVVAVKFPVKNQQTFEKDFSQKDREWWWDRIREAFIWGQEKNYLIDNVLCPSDEDWFAYILRKS